MMGLKKERRLLTHARYDKMKNTLIKETENAIFEADHEPTASLFEANQL